MGVWPRMWVLSWRWSRRNTCCVQIAEWEARGQAIRFFDDVVKKLIDGDIKSIGTFTDKNFSGPIRTIVPWTTNIYTESLIERVRKEFREDFWGFWMMGGMSGGGMGFIFDPQVKKKAMESLQIILQETKKKFEKAVPFAMDPVVYEFSINEKGSESILLTKDKALMSQWYYILRSPALLKKDINSLTPGQRNELQHLGQQSKSGKSYNQLVAGLYERMIPRVEQHADDGQTLSELLENQGFDHEVHQQIKSDYKSGRIGLVHNRLPVNSVIKDVEADEITFLSNENRDKWYHDGFKALKAGKLAIVTLAGGAGSRWTKGAGVVKALHPFVQYAGRHRSFIELHLLKNQNIRDLTGVDIPHVLTTSFLTHEAIKDFLGEHKSFGFKGPLYLSPGRSIGLRLIPTERELRYLWEVLPQQILDIQEQKVLESQRSALINWAKKAGEGEDYLDNLPHQCVHPVGHWYEIPNMLLNGTLHRLLQENPDVQHLLIHNVDTLGANADPSVFGFHLSNEGGLSSEVINRRLNDRGGGLAKVDGRLRIIEGLALPDEKIEFELSYYNSGTFWLDLQKLLELFELSRNDLGNPELIRKAVRRMSKHMPTYITIKDVKKRWGKGQEDIFPVAQFEKLWGDMTSLPDIDCRYLSVPRMRGQQLKEVSDLDGWLRDGSAQYISTLCGFENSNKQQSKYLIY